MFEGWNEENTAQVLRLYKEAEPTADTSAQIVSDIAEEIGATINGVRMKLIKAGVYQKKTPATSTSSSKSGGEGSKRVSKDEAQQALKSAISAKGLEPDDDIISKLTGKAAVYFAEILGD